ncbi:uncharacterized protein LOC132263317 [Phlebotomus argentipes]|uniref:uncharacterized protein LOC132263317 n=1 Tax=Phlebotomus argentipes TaxID=94469 RepID=UPI0028930F78|nr:uncharacterized protein LOC132263317 [Phlebotomus argentipes]
MDIADNKEKICVRCDLPKTGQKSENNNIAPEHLNGEVAADVGALSGNGERPEAAQAGNLLSEDEISSNSDDCVYTYRGGHMETPMRVSQEALVDDTDFLEFLEMDFDPEPSSEQDNYPDTSYFPEIDGFIENHPLNGLHHLEQPVEFEKTADSADPESSELSQRNTGAKPKLTVANPTTRQKKSPPVVLSSPNPPRVEPPRQVREVCLECSELEILSETSRNPMKQARRCPKHTLERPKTPPDLSPWQSQLTSVHPTPPEARQLLTLNLDLPCGTEKVVKLSSVGCTEEDVVECLLTLGVKVNRTVLRSHFESRPGEESLRQMDLTDFLVHVAKENCDYRKLMDAIRAACEKSAQDLQFSFEPSKKVPEMIKVNLTDIAIRWNPSKSLRGLVNLPNKYFHTFNVVGKIANAVRQLNAPGESDECDHILVPNFYRSGFITISRRK